MSSTIYPGTPIPTRSPAWRRLLGDIAELWRGWRAEASMQRERKALEGLADATLRDIGLDRSMWPNDRSLAARDFLRGL